MLELVRILYILAIILFFFAGVGVTAPPKLSWGWLGAGFGMLAFVISVWPK